MYSNAEVCFNSKIKYVINTGVHMFPKTSGVDLSRIGIFSTG